MRQIATSKSPKERFDAVRCNYSSHQRRLLRCPQAGQLVRGPAVARGRNGDLNGDGRSDIIFRDANGTLVEWLMNGASFAAPPSVLGSAPVDFAIAAHHFELI